MEKKYEDLKMRKILFTYKRYDYSDIDTLILNINVSEEDKIQEALDMLDEKRRIESDLIGLNSASLYDFDDDRDDDYVVEEDPNFLELQDYESIDRGVMIRFYSSQEDFDNDKCFGNVIVDTKFTLDANSESEKKVIRAILREFGIGSFGNKALEKKREILFDMLVDEVVDKRKGNMPFKEEKPKCKLK